MPRLSAMHSPVSFSTVPLSNITNVVIIVEDIRSVIPGMGFDVWPIYGSSPCHEFAWAYVRDGEPNTKIVYNGM